MSSEQFSLREENDPDILQLLDQMNSDWVRLWRKKVNKKISIVRELPFTVEMPEREVSNVTLNSNKKSRVRSLQATA